MSKQEFTLYYTYELNDDFIKNEKPSKKITEKYKYLHKNLIWKIVAFFWYRIVFTPISYFYSKFTLHTKILGAKKLRKCKEGFFLFGNHTQKIGDAFTPNIVTFPKSNYVVVSSQNLSVPLMGKILPMLGALPLPDNFSASRNFMNAIEKHILLGHCVLIYPEAHVWPYYTKIRPFVSASFKYPIKYNSPSFCMTTTYQKRKYGKKPKITVFIDGPFYPNENGTPKEQEVELRNKIFDTMESRSQNNNFEYIKYIKKEK